MPFRHVALYRWDDHVDDDHVARFTTALDELAADIPGIRSVTHGPDAGVGGGSFDYVVVIDVDTEGTWRQVRDHPTYILLREELVTGHAAEQAIGQFRITDRAAADAASADTLDMSDDELMEHARRAAQASMETLLAEPDDVL